MEHKLAAAEKEVLEELVKEVQRRVMRGDNGGFKEFVAVYDETFGASMSDPSRCSHVVLVAFLETFKQKEDLLFLRRYANSLLIKKFKQFSADNETPEQSLVRKTVEHPRYSLEYSFYPLSEGWLVSDAGMKLSKVMSSTRMVAVDCEMVLCEGGTEGLVRVGVVDRNLKVILNEFVKPDKRIVDYRTAITGVTAEDINRATLSLKDIQENLWPFVSAGAILVGHSLNHDLEVLKIAHPRVIDTSYLFKYPNDQKQRRPSLNNLCRSMLGYEVQKAGVSHDCVHDAAAAMRLVVALIEKRIDTTITLSKEDLEAEKSRLFVHRIPYNLSTEGLNRVLTLKFCSKGFTLDVKPAKQFGRYYCAVVVFNSSKEAEQAFRNIDGIQEKDSLGLRQKLVRCFYVRKMVKDEYAV